MPMHRIMMESDLVFMVWDCHRLRRYKYPDGTRRSFLNTFKDGRPMSQKIARPVQSRLKAFHGGKSPLYRKITR